MDNSGPKRGSLNAMSITCDVCEKSFKYKSYSVRHKKIHSGEKQYKCDVCYKSFTANCSLVVHKRLHTGK